MQAFYFNSAGKYRLFRRVRTSAGGGASRAMNKQLFRPG